MTPTQKLVPHWKFTERRVRSRTIYVLIDRRNDIMHSVTNPNLWCPAVYRHGVASLRKMAKEFNHLSPERSPFRVIQVRLKPMHFRTYPQDRKKKVSRSKVEP